MSDRQNAEITLFRPVVPEHEINDLRERLSRARLPERETAPGWAQGIPLDYLSELLRYWRDEYDWRRVEGELASRGQSAAPSSTASAFTSCTSGPRDRTPVRC